MKSPLAPFLKMGGTVYTPTLLIVVIGVLILFQALISSPFGKRLDMSSSNVGDRGI